MSGDQHHNNSQWHLMEVEHISKPATWSMTMKDNLEISLIYADV